MCVCVVAPQGAAHVHLAQKEHKLALALPAHLQSTKVANITSLVKEVRDAMSGAPVEAPFFVVQARGWFLQAQRDEAGVMFATLRRQLVRD